MVPPSRSRLVLTLVVPPAAGNGIINAEGEYWKLQRKAGMKFLTSANLRVLLENVLPEYLSVACDHLEARARRREAADLQYVFREITSRIMGRMAYDVSL